jgi:integrase
LVSHRRSEPQYLQTYITSMNSITEVNIMAEVQAVKDLDKVKLISHLLKRCYSKQMADVWNIGLNLALRISDLLSVKFNDIQDDRLLIKASKTGKLANIQLNKKAITTIKQVQTEHPSHIYLFQSYRNQQATNKAPKPLTRRAVSEAFAMIGKEVI